MFFWEIGHFIKMLNVTWDGGLDENYWKASYDYFSSLSLLVGHNVLKCVVLCDCEWYVLNMSGFIQNMNGFFPYITGLVLNMTIFIQKWVDLS